MIVGWLQIAVELIPEGLPLPQGTRALKAEAGKDGRTVFLLVEHEDIPEEADWIAAQFCKTEDGPVRFDKWVVIPPTDYDALDDWRSKL